VVESKAESASEIQPEGERSSAGTTAPGTLAAGPKPRSSIGHRVGVAVYWVFITFVIAFGARSVTQQVFWPRADATPSATSCGEGLRALAAELRAFAADNASQPSTSAPAADDDFFRGWDARQHALDPLCTGDAARDASGTLARYRFSLEQSLVRHRREETELSRDLDARLAALRP
jgi:hypothetical protein